MWMTEALPEHIKVHYVAHPFQEVNFKTFILFSDKGKTQLEYNTLTDIN